jgi:transaldolase/glucose-6-phosphate isomerase
MKDNPLKKLETLGQSIWLDYIRRDLITGGEENAFIEQEITIWYSRKVII